MIRLGRFQVPKLTRIAQICAHSTNTAAQTDQTTDKFDAKFVKQRKITRTIDRAKKIKKTPFLLDCYYGVFDKDVLAFPEVMYKDDFEYLINLRVDISQNPDSNTLFGICGQTRDAGFEFNETERASLSEDVLWSGNSLSKLAIHDHSTAIKIFYQFASEELKAKYLSSLISGKLKATICFTEDGFMKNSILNTIGYLNDANNWEINGKKSHVRNANDVDLFLVIADTCAETHQERSNNFSSVFLVDKNTKGVRIENYDENNTDRATIVFDQVNVPKENLIGEINMGQEIIELINDDSRIISSVHCVVILRKIITNLIEYANRTVTDKFPLAYSDYVQKLFSMIACDLHTTEAMVYLTTGIMDKYEVNSNFAEIAATRIFAVLKTYEALKKCKLILGHDTLKPDHWMRQLEREFMPLLVLPESTDMTLLAMSYCGIKHANDRMKDVVKKSRNVLYNPSWHIKRLLSAYRDETGDPQSNMDLQGYLHPSLSFYADMLEFCVHRLRFSLQEILVRNGLESVDKHSELIQLSEVAVITYAMTASLSRASRSYCIGLQNAEIELKSSSLICTHGKYKVMRLAEFLSGGPIVNGDLTHNVIAKQMFEWKDYSLSHPLCRNFN